MKRQGKTLPFSSPRGEPMPGSIAEVKYLRLGGVDQWVMIRGENVSNPQLILLHGGPGMSETSFFRHCNAALEKSFTVVYWDQRGAGKSFDRDIPPATMTVDRFISDLAELVTYVCTRLATTKITIFGHSWGSALGCFTPHSFPTKSVRTSAAASMATGRRRKRRRMPSHSQRRTGATTTRP
jgi:pimeloyl-ACP methyl ester carboxylesterase